MAFAFQHLLSQQRGGSFVFLWMCRDCGRGKPRPIQVLAGTGVIVGPGIATAAILMEGVLRIYVALARGNSFF